MINILKDIRNLTSDTVPCTLDVSSFYTNIAHFEGIQATNELLAVQREPNNLPLYLYISDLLRVAWKTTTFESNSEYNHQKASTAINTKLAPSYSNIFMSHFEEKYV